MEVLFSKHATQRLDERKIQKEEVVSAVLFSENAEKRHGKLYARKKTPRGIIEGCF